MLHVGDGQEKINRLLYEKVDIGWRYRALEDRKVWLFRCN